MIGFDLGTSCSKVVIGDPGWHDRSYAVSLSGPGHNISDWLIPTRLSAEHNLKMRLMDDPASLVVRDLLACYVAAVIRGSRTWFLERASADYRKRELRWRLNLGFPGKSLDDSPLVSAYRQVAATASALAALSQAPTPELAADIRRREVALEPLTGSAIQLYPEIAAQLAGYVNSPYRHPGNLLLIDVGAGTLDVSTIILHGDREQDVVSFHVCEVQPLGVLRLFESRVKALQAVEPGCIRCSLSDFQDGTRPAPEHLVELVNQPSSRHSTAFDRASEDFSLEMLNIATRCLVRFRQRQQAARGTRSFNPWGDSLAFFLTGGGCRSNFYRSRLAGGSLENLLAKNCVRHWSPYPDRRRELRQGLRLDSLPIPERLQNFPAFLRTDFDRLSVAYGLAFGGENLMKITTSTS